MNATVLTARCPKCGGEVHERERTFHCPACHWTLFKTMSSRTLQSAEVEALLAHGITDRLEGFRSRQGRPFGARLKLGAAPDFKPAFDFNGADRPGTGGGAGVPEALPDFAGLTPLGACPACGGRVFALEREYLCEKAAGPAGSCPFRIRKTILQTTIEAGDVRQLLAERRTGLLKGFVSRKSGKQFDAYLTLEGGKVTFEFPGRSPSGPAAPEPGATRRPGNAAEERGPADFTGQQPLGKCPRCGAGVFETEKDYVCEHGQRRPNPCGFRSARTILEQPVSREHMTRLLADGRTEVLPGFVSRKSGRSFRAALVLDGNGQVGFEFPRRGGPGAGEPG